MICATRRLARLALRVLAGNAAAAEPLRRVLAGQALNKDNVRESSPQKFAAIRGSATTA